MSTGTTSDEPRRYLISTAVAHHFRAPWFDLPDMAHARTDVIDLFTTVLGYEHVTDLGLNPTREQLTNRLRAFCRAEDRRTDDILAVYIGAHGDVLDGSGESGEHVLYTADIDPDDLADALPTVDLARKMFQDTKVRRVLLMLDTCHAGHGGAELTAAALTGMTSAWRKDPGSGLVVVTSAQLKEEAAPRAFPRLLRAAVEGILGSGYTGAALPLDKVVEDINRAKAGHQTISSTLAQMTGQVPPFLPNLGHGLPVDPVEPGARIDDGTYRYAAEAYLSWAVDEWSAIDLGDLGREQDGERQDEQQDGTGEDRVRWLPLERMYISLQADPRSLVDRRNHDELRRRDQAGHAPGTSAQDAIAGALAGGPRAGAGIGGGGARSISLEEAFGRHRLLVVLGDPGSGKSVMCQWLGHQLALEGRDLLRRRAAEPFRLPVRFRVADFAQHLGERLAADEPTVFSDFLATLLPDATEIGYPRTTLSAMFSRALTDGRAVLLIDGLDEVTRHRTEVVDAVARLVERYVLGQDANTSQAVITSRVAGYDDLYLSLEEAAHYLIRPMADEQIEQFVTRFFAEIRAADDVGLFMARLRAANRSVRRLARTPLLLTSMCSYWHRHYDLPPSRAELYRRLVLDTAYRWRSFIPEDDDSPLATLLTSEDQFLAMLSRVAVRIHDDRVDGQLSEDDLRATLEDALFGSTRLTRVESRRITTDLITRIRERVGILAEVAFRQFAFIHQTFREYLAGRDLLGSVTELLAELDEYLGDPRWREPVLLALGECDAATRVELVREAVDTARPAPEQWAEMFLVAALERPPEETTAEELTALLSLLVLGYEEVRAELPALDDLDQLVAELRTYIGAELFDAVVWGAVHADPSLTAPLAALHWRRRWLGTRVVESFVALAHQDTEDWDWPIQRGLRLVAAPTPRWRTKILGRLTNPADNPDGDVDEDALRLYELGHAAWERRDEQARRAVLAAPAPGLLPVRELLVTRPGRWAECRADDPSSRVLVALFGGLDHQDTVHWAREYGEFARLLQLGDKSRTAEVHRRADELVPRYGIEDTVYNIAVDLDTIQVKVDRPAPVLDVGWLTRPSTPAVRAAVLRWLGREPRHADRLREMLREVAAKPPSAQDRAEAELGLLALDGTPMTAGAGSRRALAKAYEAVGDAALRGHPAWFTVLWSDDTGLSSAERGVVHRALLHLYYGITGTPVPLRISGAVARHPVRAADQVVASVVAYAWGQDPGEPDTGGWDPRAVVSWLTTLPLLDQPHPALWHEDMPRAGAAATAALGPVLAWLRAWVESLNPWRDDDTYRELTAVLTAAAAPAPAAEPVPAALTRLYHVLYGRGRVPPVYLQAVRDLAGELPGPHTDLAYLAAGLAEGAPAAERAAWHRAALDLLATETDDAALAEALSRIRVRLDPVTVEQADRLAARIASPVLRAHALGDLAATIAEFVARAGEPAGPESRVSLLVAARLTHELARLRAAAPGEAELPVSLDAGVFDTMTTALAGDPEDRAGTVMSLVSAMTRVNDEVVVGLSALVDQAPEGARWARTAGDLLRLHRVGNGPADIRAFADLVEVVCTGDAVNATRAYLVLRGHLRDVRRAKRVHSLARCGVDTWLSLAKESVAHADPLHRWLCSATLGEWAIDSAAAVREAVRRRMAGEVDLATWHAVLTWSSLWDVASQNAVAEWLSQVDDRRDAEGGLVLASVLSTANAGPFTAALQSAAVAAALRTGTTARVVPGLSGDGWRTTMTGPVMTACEAALGLGGEEAVAAARRLFAELTVPVVAEQDGGVVDHLEAYGVLQWAPNGVQPGEGLHHLGAEVDPAAAIGVLAGWLWRLAAEHDRFSMFDPLNLVVAEALLNLLVVFSTRDMTAFRLACPPRVAQPVFSRLAVDGTSLTCAAGLTLLGRLQHVEVRPADGPALMDVLDLALRLEPLTRRAALEFLRTVRHLRGDSFVPELLDRVESTANETVAQAFAMLAVTYLGMPACSRPDRRRIRQALLTAADRDQWAHAVHLVGQGNENDPITAMRGPGRRTEFRRLVRLSMHVPDPMADVAD